MDKKTNIKILEFRILQLELALGSLMQVVAFPEKHESFRDRMSEALEIAEEKGINNILDVIVDEGAEA
jgi:hypothetical protein